MTRRTTTELGPDGSPVVRHLLEEGEGVESLRREAALLELAQGPGVVELVATGVEPDGDTWLTTRYLAGGTLTDLLRAGGEPAATAALARVARTLADLHERGVVHGRCTADHVVGGASGASLCGFSGATAAALDGSVDPQVDRSDLATLVTTTLRSDSDVARRARRAVAGLAAKRHGTNLRAVAAELWALARESGWVDPDATGPTSVRIAPDAGAPDEQPVLVHRRPRRVEGEARARVRPSTRSARSMGLAMAVAAVAACAVLLGALVARDSAPSPAARSAEQVAAPHPRPTSTVTTGAPERVWAPGGPDSGSQGPARAAGRPGSSAGTDRAGSTGPEGADRDADGDPDPAPTPDPLRPARPGVADEEASPRPAEEPAPPTTDRQGPLPGSTTAPGTRTAPRPDGAPGPGAGERAAGVVPPADGGVTGSTTAAAVLEHEGSSYAIGAPGEIVLVGDWDCDGTPTPSVVRPADGSVWTFRAWSAGGEVVTAEPLGRTPSAVTAMSRRERGGCDVIAVTTADGREVVVRPG